MCAKCNVAGCRHDWQQWTPLEFKSGYDDGFSGQASKANKMLHGVGLSAYRAGFVAGRVDKNNRDYD